MGPIYFLSVIKIGSTIYYLYAFQAGIYNIFRVMYLGKKKKTKTNCLVPLYSELRLNRLHDSVCLPFFTTLSVFLRFWKDYGESRKTTTIQYTNYAQFRV